MTQNLFHLGWFMNFTPDEWPEPFGQGGSPWDGQFYIEMAETAELGDEAAKRSGGGRRNNG